MKILNREKTEKPDVTRSTFGDRYRIFCYKHLGKRLDNKTNEALADKLRRANVSMTPGLYQSIIYFTVAFSALVSFLLTFAFFFFIGKMTNWPILVFLITSLSAGVSYGYLPMVTNMRISKRKVMIDKELPFSLSELSILASTGLSPIHVIKRMAARTKDEAMATEFKKIVFKAEVEGKDLITALGETAKETPSEALRDSLWDLANMIHQGGNLDDYLRTKADDVMNMKRSVQKELIEKLMGTSDMYVSLVLVGVLFIGIGAFLIDAMNSTAGGLSADTLLILLAYVMVPVASFAFIMIVSSSYSKVE
jgi:archaeal flagellar protein FlaJ